MISLLIATSFIVTIILAMALLVFKIVDLKNDDKKQMLFISLGATLVICFIITGIGYAISNSKTYYNEIWNYKGVNIRHELKWTTHETETYEVEDGKDSKGNTKYKTKTRHYTETHGPYWYMTDEYGSTSSISEDEYNYWKNIWKGEKKVGMHEGSSAGFDTSIDGPIFEAQWAGTFETIMPLSKTNSYQNKVRASKYSVLKFKSADKELKDKYPRPADGNNSNPFIDYGSPVNVSGDDILLLRRTNAFLGSRYQVHALFVLFKASDSVDKVNDVISAWQGPNKNELVTFMGIDKDTKKISWVKIESWMDDTTINGFIVDSVLDKKFNSIILSDALKTYVPKYWHRKSFKEFDYLKIEVSPVTFVVVLVLQLVVMVIMFFAVNYNVKNPRRYSYGVKGIRGNR